VTFRHVVMFTWSDDVEPSYSDAVGAALSTLPGLIPEIAAYHHGPDAGVNEGNFDYVVVADFDNMGDWRAFREHPAHLLFMEEHITGRFKNRAAIQYQTPADPDPFDFSHARMQEFLAEIDELG
jgi:hypothetical protein